VLSPDLPPVEIFRKIRLRRERIACPAVLGVGGRAGGDCPDCCVSSRNLLIEFPFPLLIGEDGIEDGGAVRFDMMSRMRSKQVSVRESASSMLFSNSSSARMRIEE